jgi:7-cyano-7-deazaguanine synthase
MPNGQGDPLTKMQGSVGGHGYGRGNPVDGGEECDVDRRAVVLLSGGLDSATVAAMVASQGYEIFALSFSYGQRHAAELEAAAEVALRYGAKRHVVAQIDLRIFGGSALTDDLPVPKHDHVAEVAADVPVTYVPARNTIFLSYALAFAEVVSARNVFIGVNALDYSGYPDCRPEYIAAYENMANLATRAGVQGGHVSINAPLVEMTKAEIIRTGLSLGVDYSITRSCYDPDDAGRACGHCDACLLRLKGFVEAGISDPAPYR